MRAQLLLTFLLLGGVVLGYGGIKLTRGAYETPAYTVVESVDGIELRDYPGLELVSTDCARLDGSDGSFMRLFRYIDGANDRALKIDMTTPVLLSAGDSDATNTTSAGRMSFVLPQAVAAEQPPAPTGAGVWLTQQPAMRFAVARFKGRDEASAAIARLRRVLQERGVELLADVEPLVAFYDPPWTPAALRRNEVLLPVAPGARLQSAAGATP